MSEATEHTVAWVGGRVFSFRVTLGLLVRSTAPFAHKAPDAWHLVPHPFLAFSSEKAGDASMRLEWLGVTIYLRATA